MAEPHQDELALATYELIIEHVELVGRTLTRQIRRAVPRYAEVDLDAHTRDVVGLLKVLGPVFRGEEPTELLQNFGQLMRVRIIEGIEIDDFMAATLCTLPTLRAFLGRHASDRRQASAMYREVERVLIPFFGRCARLFVTAMLDQSSSSETGGPNDGAMKEQWRASTIAFQLTDASLDDSQD